MTKKPLLHQLAIMCCALVALISSTPALPQEADAPLEAFFNRYLDASFLQQPVMATSLGDHRFDSRLEDLSASARQAWLELDRRTLEELPKSVDVQHLSPAGRMDYEIFRDHLNRSIWMTENFHPFEDDPRTYSDYLSDSVYLLLTQSTLPLETNVSNAIARMGQLQKIVAAARENLRNPPRVHLETAIRQNDGAISFYEKDIFAFVGDTRQLPALKDAAAKAAAVLKNYGKFLKEELLPKANGEWRIGRVKFERKLDLTLDAGLDASQVLQEAQAEYDRVQNDMYVIARQLWSVAAPGKPLPPQDDSGRHETIRQVLAFIAKDHSTPTGLIDDVRQTVAKIKTFIRDHHILALPEPDTCAIVEMPEFKRGNSTAYMQSPPPLDPHATGFFAVSPPPSDWDAARVESYFQEYNRCMLPILAIHEGYPGHYVQLEYANRVPSKIRKVLQSGAYIEGWAVYTEQMMLDQGFGAQDLALRLTQLKFYLRAVANTILDHRMHCDQMSDEEAMKLLVDGAYQSEGEARLKVIRSKQSSVQLSTYFTGRMAMARLRQSVQRELGDKFDLSRYHEAVLAPGPVPLKYLPALVRQTLRP